MKSSPRRNMHWNAAGAASKLDLWRLGDCLPFIADIKEFMRRETESARHQDGWELLHH
jgi:hypothetical protein